MCDNRRILLLAAAALIAVASGCQTFSRHGTASGGPSRSFGLDYVPPQSEPPLEGAAETAKSDSGQGAVKTASLQEPADEGSARSSGGLSRLLPRREKDPPKSKPLPVSSRVRSTADSAESARDAIIE